MAADREPDFHWRSAIITAVIGLGVGGGPLYTHLATGDQAAVTDKHGADIQELKEHGSPALRDQMAVLQAQRTENLNRIQSLENTREEGIKQWLEMAREVSSVQAMIREIDERTHRQRDDISRLMEKVCVR